MNEISGITEYYFDIKRAKERLSEKMNLLLKQYAEKACPFKVGDIIKDLSPCNIKLKDGVVRRIVGMESTETLSLSWRVFVTEQAGEDGKGCSILGIIDQGVFEACQEKGAIIEITRPAVKK